MIRQRRTLHPRTTPLALLAATLITGAGCLGTVSAPPAPDERVASLTLLADQHAALIAQGCAQPNDCRLPNRWLCVKLVVDVYGDGHTIGTCTTREGQTLRLKGAADGIPLKCRSHTGQYAVQCLDTNNNVAMDATEGSASIYPLRAPSWYRPAIGNNVKNNDTAYLTEGQGVPTAPDDTTQPQGPSASTPPADTTPKGPTQAELACYNAGVAAFNSAFQGVVHQEGFTGITFSPAPPQSSSNFYQNGSYQNDASAACQTPKPACKQPGHWSQWLGGNGFQWYGGGCYCSVTNHGPSCYASLMVASATAQACQARPPQCDVKVWAAAVQDAVPPAKQWVDAGNSKTNTKAGVTEGAKAGWSLLQALGSMKSWGGVNSYGSPLVLDLAGDGVALTSADRGVDFDLTGAGVRRTAWVAGQDDALLAIDLDGNGRIDDGGELFGEASRLGGLTSTDGFAALALVDNPRHGGNGNGLAEAGDLLFDQLLLWRDSNRDGVSQAAELTALRECGVRALEVTAASSHSVLDAHGNDLGTRGSFLRADGSTGALIDVYFLRRRQGLAAEYVEQARARGARCQTPW